MTPGAATLRALVGLGPVVAVLVAAPSGVLPAVWFAVVLGVVSVGAAVAPESPLSLTASVLAAGWWLLGAGGELTGPPVTALLAAVALTVGHVAATVVAYGPIDLPVDRAVVGLWAARTTLAVAVGALAWLLARAVEGQATPGGVWAVAVLALAGAVAWAGAHVAPRAVALRSPGDRGRPRP